MGPNETVEIRRALDKLQQTFEALNDRYRDLRRERKQLRERIDELVRERDASAVANAAQLEMARKDRDRAGELEERLRDAERRGEESFNRVADLERDLAGRDQIIVDQEDALARLRAELEAARAREEDAWMQSEHRREEFEDLRRQLGQAQAESESYRAQLDQIASDREGEATVTTAEIESIRSESAALRKMIEQLQEERAEIEAKHLEAAEGLEAATLAETTLRADIATLRQENAILENALDALRKSSAELEHRLAGAAGRSGGGPGGDGEPDARERRIAELHAALERRQEMHAAEVAQLEERLAATELERERLERQVGEIRNERDTMRQRVEALKLDLSRAEADDDERLRAQRTRMEELQRELNQALDIAARREMEAAGTAQELETALERLARVNDELERLGGGHAAENGAAGGVRLSEEERRQIAEKIDTAILLIDRHLQSE